MSLLCDTTEYGVNIKYTVFDLYDEPNTLRFDIPKHFIEPLEGANTDLLGQFNNVLNIIEKGDTTKESDACIMFYNCNGSYDITFQWSKKTEI